MKINMLLVIAFSGFAVMSGVVFAEYYQNTLAIKQGLQQCKVWNDDHTRYDIVWRKTCYNED